MADEIAILMRWVGKLDDRIDDLIDSVEAEDLSRADRNLDTLRAWLLALEAMINDTEHQPFDQDVYTRFALRFALVEARLRSVQYLIQHKRTPWWQRHFPWIIRIARFLLDRIGFGPFLPRLPSGF